MKSSRMSLRIFLFVTLMVCLSSCEVDIHNERDEYTLMLCCDDWYEYYTDEYGNPCYQELSFYRDGRGRDYTCIEAIEGTYTKEYSFRWWWEDPYTICMQYPDGYSYLEDVYLTDYRLTGWLDGAEVHFTRK